MFRFNRVCVPVLFSLYLLCSSVLYGQNKDWKPLFPAEDVNFRLSGWYVGAGATYTIAWPSSFENVYNFEDSTRIIANFGAYGNPRFVVEGGRYTMTYSYFIPYLDYGVMFKSFSGVQNYTGYIGSIDVPDTISTSTLSANFNTYIVSAHFNANNTIRISEFGFIQNTLGVNFDYKITETISGDFPVFNDTKSATESFLFQLHYKIGYGLRLDKKHFLLFTLETPLINAFPAEELLPSISIFNSQYQPIIFTVRLMFLNNKTRPDCNNNPDVKMKKKRKEARLF